MGSHDRQREPCAECSWARVRENASRTKTGLHQTNYRGVQKKTSQSRRGSGPPTALSMGRRVLPEYSSSIGKARVTQDLCGPHRIRRVTDT